MEKNTNIYEREKTNNVEIIFLNDVLTGLFSKRKWIIDVTGTNTVFDVKAGNRKLGLFKKTLERANRSQRSSALDR